MTKIVINTVSTYFAKNLQMIGFSSPQKAFLTTIKEFIDNSLDACNEHKILPEIELFVEKLGPGHTKNTDRIRVVITDNGPGIEKEDVAKAFGVMLASNKFGRYRVTRGVQGLGASAAVMWGQLTNASGIRVISKTKSMKQAYSCMVEIDISNNTGVPKEEKFIGWDRQSGLKAELIIDGKIQLNGESGILNFLTGTCLMNPDLTLRYKLPDMDEVEIKRVSEKPKTIPDPVSPHPHTLKLGEFISHLHLFSEKTSLFLKTRFSRVSDSTIKDIGNKLEKRGILSKKTDDLSDNELKDLYKAVQETRLLPPSTSSLTSVGEEALSESIKRLGNVDFFSVVTRKPTVCDFKPIQIEVALARLSEERREDDPVQVLRFANFVPLLFERNSDVSIEAIQSVNWRAYGLNQRKGSLPTGPYIFAISVISPFIKFKNASKEAIDASDELLEEIRLALIQAGQKLAKHIKKEEKERDLEKKRAYIEQFAPILLDTVFRISNEPKKRRKAAESGLRKILGRDEKDAEDQLKQAEKSLNKLKEKE
jgi:DNA topoisomerase-6 subunit B